MPYTAAECLSLAVIVPLPCTPDSTPARLPCCMLCARFSFVALRSSACCPRSPRRETAGGSAAAAGVRQRRRQTALSPPAGVQHSPPPPRCRRPARRSAGQQKVATPQAYIRTCHMFSLHAVAAAIQRTQTSLFSRADRRAPAQTSRTPACHLLSLFHARSAVRGCRRSTVRESAWRRRDDSMSLS